MQFKTRASRAPEPYSYTVRSTRGEATMKCAGLEAFIERCKEEVP